MEKNDLQCMRVSVLSVVELCNNNNTGEILKKYCYGKQSLQKNTDNDSQQVFFFFWGGGGKLNEKKNLIESRDDQIMAPMSD